MDIVGLERRIENLEIILGIKQYQEGSESIIQQIITQESQIIELNHKSEKEINSQIYKLIKFLHVQGQESQLSMKEKAQIILNLQDQFTKGKEQLQKILKLSKHVNFDPIIKLDSKQDDISLLQTASELEYMQHEQVECKVPSQNLLSQKFNESQTLSEELVSANENIVNKINEKLIFYSTVMNKQNK